MIRLSFEENRSLKTLIDDIENKCIEDKKKIQQVVRDTGANIQKEAKANLEKNGNIKTRKLYGSIKGRYTTLGTYECQYLVKASAKHAIYIEEGTKPHIIKAKNAKALRFLSGGKVVYAKQVFHPGTKASPFMETAFFDNVPKFIDSIEEVIGKWT